MMKNAGMSEVLGAVLMIAVFVAGFGILGVTYFSQQPSEKIPQVSFDLRLGSDSVIYLTHAGGDSLRTYNPQGEDASSNAEYYILVDNTNIWPIKNAALPLLKGEQAFTYSSDPFDSNISNLKVGEGFKVQPNSLPKNIDVVYNSPSGIEKIIWSGLIPRIIDFGTGGGGFGPGGARIGVNGSVRVCINEEVPFYDSSLGNVVYSDWDFDVNVNPGIDSYELNPNWTYTTTGFFTVTHNIRTDEGLNFTLTKENYIEVKPVHADFSESWDPDSCAPGDNACTYCRQNYPGKPCGREPFHVDFHDGSYCSPTSWSWNLGAGPVVSAQNPSYDYIYDYTNHDGKTGNNTFYTVSLTASNSGGSDTYTKPDHVIVLATCFDPIADFSYDGIVDLDGNMAVDFTDLSTSVPEEIREWVWDFGDGTSVYIGDSPPTHEYSAGVYTVKLIITNDCGKSAEKSRKIEFPCPGIVAGINAEPKTGDSPLTVNFTDLSTPRENITGWRWSFGDGTFYYTDNASNPNPPPHNYTRVGTFYASLMAQNKCGQAFVNTSVFVVSKDASISGKIWNDRDENRVQNAGEIDLFNWTVDLEERKSGGWEVVNTTRTNSTGQYAFNLVGVSNSVFRVREFLPDPTAWRVTYSYGTYNQQVSDNLLIYDKRDYSDIDFGNNDLHRSKISVPGVFVLKKTGGKGFYNDNTVFKYSSLNPAAQYLDYNTTYNGEPRVVFLSSTPSPNGSFNPDPPGGYPQGYTVWGDSSFTLKMRKYNTYLKQVGEGAYFLDLWQYNSGSGWVNYNSGDSFYVPDNTTISSEQLRLIYYYHPEDVFEFDKPDEGATVPYVALYTVEAHMEGINEQKDKARLISPVDKPFSYNSTVGEYLVTKIDTRPFEGQTKLFKGEMILENSSKLYCYANATIDWEPNAVSILNITSDVAYGASKTVKGNTTVWASIEGKWQLNSSAKLILNDKVSLDMTVMSPGYNTKVRAIFNAEPFSGMTIPAYVMVPHAKGPQYTKNSIVWNMTALSKLPIKADFSADPWKGQAPHEVAFTDLSTGGAKQWLWDFKDGESSTKENPIHIFAAPGNYSVRLTVTNATPATDYTEKNITVTGLWHHTNLLTNRVTMLPAGGVMSFISRGYNSNITINNSEYNLPDGSNVELSLNSDHGVGKMFMAGGITECNLSDVTMRVNDEYTDKGAITNIRVQDFENFHSNISLTADRSYTAWVSFQWDNSAIPISWKRVLTVKDLMPTPERFMSLELSPTQTFYDGMAGNYYIL